VTTGSRDGPGVDALDGSRSGTPVPYWEALNRPRTYDYPLSILVLNLDEDNKGEGTIAIGVRLKFDNENNSLEIENFSSQPVRLTNVRKTS